MPRGPLMGHPRVSVVMAVRNEAAHIERALLAVCAQSYPRERLEILVVDGDSDDATPRIVQSLATRDGRIRLLHNPGRCVAAGLNVGLAVAAGDVIVRVDGHCLVPPDYVATCVRLLAGRAADCVGGPVRAEGDAPLARAIAMAMSTPFGVGGASFRWADSEREVDHLPFGAWRREVFDAIGGFDESLLRNQDDELSDRLRRAGGRILMTPAIPVRYFARSSLGALFRQYWGYGFWKVRVIRGRGGWPSSPRHVVPAAFVLATLGLCMAAPLAGAWWLPLISLAPYVAFLALATLHLAAKRRDGAAWLAPLAITAMHVAYGAGFLAALAHPAAGEPAGTDERKDVAT